MDVAWVSLQMMLNGVMIDGRDEVASKTFMLGILDSVLCFELLMI